MKNRYIAPTLAVTLVLGACTSETGTNSTSSSQENTASSSTDPRIHNTVQVKNILNVPILLSDNPETWSQETNRGSLPAGALATAICIDNMPAFPGSSSVYVYHSGETRIEGYASVDSASTKDTVGPHQLEPGYEVLAATLPDCKPGFKG